jgi:hypothetical protein
MEGNFRVPQMLGSSSVDAQLSTSQEVLTSVELLAVSYLCDGGGGGGAPGGVWVLAK